MKDVRLYVGKTKRGGFKVYVVGQPEDHQENNRGPNNRRATPENQPHRGFKTRLTAEQWAREKFPTYEKVQAFGQEAGDGTFCAEEDFSVMEFKPVSLVGKPHVSKPAPQQESALSPTVQNILSTAIRALTAKEKVVVKVGTEEFEIAAVN